MTAIPDFLDAATRAFPDQLALGFQSRRWTFAQYNAVVGGAAASLAPRLADLPESGRIGILSTNRPGYAFAVFAALRLGTVVVPLNTRLAEEELGWQVADAGVRLLIADEAHWDVASLLASRFGCATLPMAELENAPPRATRQSASYRVDLRRDAAVIYTSGTSGRPKGARITSGNLWSSAVASALHLGHRRDDAWLAVLPLFHIGGLSILVRGAIGAVPVLLHDRFEAPSVNAAIDASATLVSLVPTMLGRLIADRGQQEWPSTLRCVLLGGSATPQTLVEEAMRLAIPIAPTYGLTESSSQATTLLPERLRRKPGSSGVPLPTTELRVVNDGQPAVPGEIGGIELRGPMLFAGYLGQPRFAGVENDAWFATGDDGYLDDDGYLFVVDRRTDLIVSGGENIYPAEIERVLLAHPLVEDAAVVGVAARDWGQRPAAAVVWAGDPVAAESQLIAHCATRLGRFKVPARVILLPSLPRSPSGKLLRRVIRDSLAQSDPG